MLKKFFALALMLVMLIFVGNAEAGTITTTYLPLQCYVDHQVNTYSNPGSSKAGYISANVDLIQVTQIRNDGWVYGSYPGRNGRVARWFRMSDLCADTNYSNRFAYVSGAQRVFRTNGRGDTIGSVSNNEPVIVIADNGNRAQIIYRLDNGTGYKLGWIPSSAVAGGNQRGGDQPINNINHNPQGTVEQVNSPSPGVLHVRGKAYDLDNARGSIRLHVYVGGGAGSGAPSYEIRTDGSSNIFDDTRQVSRKGNQRVHIYALNDYGSGENKEIWNGVVNIKGNTPDGNWDSKVGQQLANINSDNYKSKNPYYRYGYSRQCTWYAWGRMREVTGKEISFGGSYPRANLWNSKTTNCSMCELQSRCVAVRMSGGGGNGHVAFVEYVDNNHVYYTDDNWSSKTNLKVQRKTIGEFKNLYQYFIR